MNESTGHTQTRIDAVREFMKSGMTADVDYGLIPGKGTKPTLLKPGAQKLMAEFGLASQIKNIERAIKFADGLVMYEVTVTLLNKESGLIEAEGVGMCSSQERKYKNQNAAEIANTVLKMAKKRGLIDAVIDATGASVLFTQDIEDMDSSNFSPQQSTQRRPDTRAPLGRQADNSSAIPKFAVVPFGNEKGTPFKELDLKQLNWWRGRVADNLNPQSQYYKAEYAELEQKRLDYIDNLLLDIDPPPVFADSDDDRHPLEQHSHDYAVAN